MGELGWLVYGSTRVLRNKGSQWLQPEGVILSHVSIIADSSNDQDGDVLLFAGVEYPESFHFSYQCFVVNALETFEELWIPNEQFTGGNRGLSATLSMSNTLEYLPIRVGRV